MPLYSLDDKEQRAIGQRDHWDLFRIFQGSPFHLAIVRELEPYLSGEKIYSVEAGSSILAKLETEVPHVVEAYPHDVRGGLFGMTLWNLLAQRQEDWYFSGMTNALDEPWGYAYFRRGR
ncbi:MAG: hypothetical protein HZB53_05290 [Chloroflexi bacterium]|nr:hypothetical protein [Chloroflexota bacterium]